MAKPAHISHPKTTERVIELLGKLDWSGGARVLDVGAGNGHFSYVLGETLAGQGLEPRDHVVACDMCPEEFEYERVECRGVGADGVLPFEDASFEATISIEVIEHVEDQFAFLREMTRVTRPGGTVVVTTPNVLNLPSRVRSFACGFPELFDPLPLDGRDARYLGGHIHPISPYFLAYGAHRSGLRNLDFHFDRTKRSAAAWTVVFAPLLALGTLAHRKKLKRKRPDIYEQNRALLEPVQRWGLLTSRTTIVRGQRPGSAAGS